MQMLPLGQTGMTVSALCLGTMNFGTRTDAGTARRIIKPGQYFSRTHVEDIAQVLAASIARCAPAIRATDRSCALLLTCAMPPVAAMVRTSAAKTRVNFAGILMSPKPMPDPLARPVKPDSAIGPAPVGVGDREEHRTH